MIGRSLIRRGLLVLAAAMAALGSSQSSSAMMFVPEGMIALPDCSTLPARQDEATKAKSDPTIGADPRIVVRVLIGEDLAAMIRRGVHYKIYVKGQSEIENDVTPPGPQTPVGSTDTTYVDNPYHLDISSFKIVTSGSDFVKVKVVLIDKRLTFAELKDVDGNLIRGVAVPRSKQPPMLCQDSAHAIRDANYTDPSALTFFVKRSILSETSVNLAIRARRGKGQDTPIFIDPRIKNNG